MSTRIAIAGINGRMGQETAAAAQADADVDLVAGIVRPDAVARAAEETGARLVDCVEAIAPEIDVVIDFTAPAATIGLARACAAARRAFVTGTTGLTATQQDELRAIAGAIPVFAARNMSVGLSAVLAILPALVRALDGYDVEIVERHHRHKLDAPSGTALALAEAIAAVGTQPLAERATYGRAGVAPRTPGEIGLHAVRAGGIAGEHSVFFADAGEEVVVTHRAFSRRTFALGTLRAAKFVAAQPAGFYAMDDLVVADRPN